MTTLHHDDPSLSAARRVRGGVLPHVPPPASPVSSTVRLVLQAPADSYPEAVLTDPRREHGWRVALQPSQGTDGEWHADILLPQEPTVLSYVFELADGTVLQERRQNEGTSEMLFGVWVEQPHRLAVWTPESLPPAWTSGAVVYQIFPDRFARGEPENLHKGAPTTYGRDVIINEWGDKPEHPPKGRDFYGGDLRGVIEKLPYIHELGITCIYFTPIFASPTNHRYDAIDYTRIDPRLGTEDDLRELIEKAGELGIRIQLDGEWNHCSKDSIYFKAAQEDKLSPYYRWFHFTEWPHGYEGWSGVQTMPEFVECPEVEEFFFGAEGIAHRWLALGTAGWRTDVTPWITHEYWRRFRRAVRKDYPEAYLIAEDWSDATDRLVGDSFDATMNYRFGYSVLGYTGGKLSASELDDRLETLRRDTPEPFFHAQLNLIGSHDTARILTVLEGNPSRVKLAAALQLAYPGVPMVYYGDEAGIEGEYAEDSRRAYPWDSPDANLLEFYRKAINTRRGSKALSCGTVQTVYIGEPGGYGFLRRHGDETVLALFNSGSQPLEIDLALEGDPKEGEWWDLLGQLPAATLSGSTIRATLPPLGAGWFAAPR